MVQPNLGLVRAIVAEANPSVRQGVRNALYGMGFREIVDTGSITKAQDLCAQSAVDLLIINSDLENNDSSLLVRELRRMKLGKDPFVVVISLLPIADELHVRKAVDCGVDDLLLLPVIPQQMSLRLYSQVKARKPFMVTHDYIGPDRRKSSRPPEGANAFHLNAPNPLAARAMGVPQERYMQLVEQAAGAIREQRGRSLTGFIKREGTHFYALARDGQPLPDDLAYRMFRLETMLDELLDHSGNAAELIQFSQLCGRIKGAASSASLAEIEQLYTQAQALAARYGST
jgi:DNA-binding NarL/FixJ family response regulator